MLTFVGAATLDALALVEHYPDADERVVATELAYAGGGPAATAAVVAARLGHEVAFVGAVGDDEEGERILAGLRSEGILTDGITVRPGVRSAASVVVVAAATATRAICNRPLPLGDLTARARELLAGAEWVHLDHLGWSPAMTALAGLDHRPLVSYDGGHQVSGFTAAGLDLYAPTVEALRTRFGDHPAPELVRTARQECGGLVVATRGSAGALALDADDRLHVLPAFDLAVVSTLGAGDVFHGALVAGLAEKRPLPEAVRRASAVAALSCRALDGRSAVPTAAELEAYLAGQARPAPATVS